MQPRQTNAVDQFVAREANGYKAEGFSRDRVFISIKSNQESSLPGVTSVQNISFVNGYKAEGFLRDREFLTSSVFLGCTRQPESRPFPSRKAQPIMRQESRPDQPLTAQRGWSMTCLTGRFQSQITSRFVARTWPGCCGGLSPANA